MIWTPPRPLLLASTSPTRRMLLEKAGLVVETQSPGIDERAIEREANLESPEKLAARLAAAKALAVSRAEPGRIVLGADQVLWCEGRALHKPADRKAALEQLEGLSGRTHTLHSAGALARDGVVIASFGDSARLTMRNLGTLALNRYLDLAGAEALKSVGCYQVEGLGIHLFAAITGEHTTILGLPLLPLLEALRRLGFLALDEGGRTERA